MSKFQKSLMCCLLLAACMPVPGFASGDWVIDSELRVSEGGTWSSFLAGDRRVGEGGHVFVEGGRTWVDSEELNLNTRSLTLGGGFRPAEDYRLSGWYNHWGRSGDITSDSFTANLGWRGERLRVSVLPGSRFITLHGGAPAGEGDNGLPISTPGNNSDDNGDDDEGEVSEDFDLMGVSGGLRLSWDLTSDWQLAASGTWISYDEDPSLLASREGADRFSENAITLAQGFPEHRYSVELRRELGDWREIGLRLGRDRSAVDGIGATSASLRFLTPIGNSWDIEVETAVTRTGDFGSSLSAGVIFTWFP